MALGGALSPAKYFALSVVCAAAVVWHAFSTREQFFPSMVYLSSSKFSLAVLGNLGFATALATYKVLLRIFLGRLRDSEVERVNDKVGQAVVETCLAMTIFREDFTAAFLSMFIILSFVKIFHWLVQDRVDFIETTPNVTRLQHFRIVAFTLVLLAIDVAFLQYSLGRTMAKVRRSQAVGVDLLFAFEYTVQASTIVLTFVKYCMSMVDMAMEGRWEGKGAAVFYLELTLDMLHLLVYCAFFAVVFSTYGIPLHLVRDLYWTFRNFQTRVRDFLRYRRLTANMDQSFPDATEGDLQRADHVCIICREEMTTQGRNKKLGCNHCFHLHCLRSWLERQQNCPICRRSVVPPQPAAAPVAGAGVADVRADDLQAAAEALRAAAAQNLQRAQGAAGQLGEAPDAAGAAAAQQPQPPGFGFQALPQPGQQPQLRRRRGWRIIGGGGGEAAAPGPAAAPLQGMGMEGGGWHMVAHYPQWVPAMPQMALFMPGGGMPQIQYAGQQTPEQVLQAQQQQAAAAAAAGIAGVMQLPLMVSMGMGLPYMMPPMAHSPAAAEGAAPSVLPTPQQHAAALAAAAAAAASLLGPAGGAGVPSAPPADPATAAAIAAAAAAMERVLRQQLDALRAAQEQAAAAAAVAPPPVHVATGSSSAAGAPAAAPAAPARETSLPVAPAPSPSPEPLAAAASSDASCANASVPASAVAPTGDAPAAAYEASPSNQQQQQQAAEEEDSESNAIRRRRLERFGGGGA